MLNHNYKAGRGAVRVANVGSKHRKYTPVVLGIIALALALALKLALAKADHDPIPIKGGPTL